MLISAAASSVCEAWGVSILYHTRSHPHPLIGGQCWEETGAAVRHGGFTFAFLTEELSGRTRRAQHVGGWSEEAP